jgi:GTP-binding protein
VESTDSANEFIVAGRGELHLAILIETMRRELYEFTVSKPEVIFRQTNQGVQEPVEHVFIEVANDYLGAVSELVSNRQGRFLDLRYGEDSSVYAEYHVPTRGMLGFRQPFLTLTRGTGIFHTLFHDYQPIAGEIGDREFGSLIALETGTVKAYALEHLQQRGIFFVEPGDEVYVGQVVGQNIRHEDLVINVCKAKNATGHRATPKSIADSLAPATILSLDDAIEYLSLDELLEVTPTSLRIRKKDLNHDRRMREEKRKKNSE